MELNLKRPIIFFDLETTGVDITRDRIVEICYIKVYPDGREVEYCKRINPGMHIPEGASAVHGIYDEDVKDAPTFAHIADQVRAFIGDSVVLAHNAGFDLKVLKATVRYYGIDFEDVDYICTWKLSKKLYPELPSRSLDSLARRINFTFSHHNALEDAKAYAAVFHRMEEELFPESITSVIKPSRYCFRDFGMLYSQQ